MELHDRCLLPPCTSTWQNGGKTSALLPSPAVLALWSLANYMSGVWHFFRFPGVPKPPRPPRQ